MLKTLGSRAAAALDAELMSSGRFSIDQLMELAGLAVAKVVYKEFPPGKVVVLVGPGNNGGDGLVAARHLKLWGHDPVVYYPKKLTKLALYGNLLAQLQDLSVPELLSEDELENLLKSGLVLVVLDALFGFSFKPPIREPFGRVLSFLSDNHDTIAPIVSVDVPSGWDVDEGPLEVDIKPKVLVLLTAPKTCAKWFEGEGKVHYLGGRFISDKIAKKYGIEGVVNLYQGDELVVKL